MLKPSRPILRYHGGKWELASWIISRLPSHRVYVEPYGGAASVLMKKPRAYGEVYNDLDNEVVNLFRVLRDSPEDLASRVIATPFSRAEYVAAFSHSDDPIEWARRILVRSHMGFAGAATHGKLTGFRAASTNSGSHPAQQWRAFPPSLAATIERWRGVVIENREATEIIAQQDAPSTLFYLDPPYVFSTRDHGTDYRHELSDEQHRSLAEQLRDINGMAVLSGYHSPLYDELFGDWHQEEREAISEAAGNRVEVLWFNPAAYQALNSSQLLFSLSEQMPESEAP